MALLAYEYEMLYRPGNENGNEDEFSCIPVLDVPGSTPVLGDMVHFLETINTSPVDATKIKLWTAHDPVLSQVLQFVLQGWPSEVEEEALKPYFIRREELSAHAGCLLRGARVIVPPQGREEVLNILQDSHPRIVKMSGGQNGHKFRREGEKMCYLSESPKDPSLFASTPLGMAGIPMVASARRLCRSCYGKDVLADH